jgi:Periplasmic copper-binding protein (NosD)
MPGSPMKRQFKRIAQAALFGWASLHGLDEAAAEGLRILSAQEVPAVAQSLVRQHSRQTASMDKAVEKLELLGMLGDMRNLAQTAQESIVGNLETLQLSQRLARAELEALSRKGVSEDSLILQLVELICSEIEGGSAGANLIDMTVELNGYIASIKSPVFLRSANLILAETFAKAGNEKIAIRYLRKIVGDPAGPLDAESLRRLSTSLALVIAEGDIAILRDLVLSMPSDAGRGAFLTQLARNALQLSPASAAPSKRLARLKEIMSADSDAKAVSAIVQSVLDTGDDEFAAVLSQANSKFSGSVLDAAIERRISQGYALRAKRLVKFVTDAGKATTFSKRIAKVMADAGYVNMANALVPASAISSERAIAVFKLPADILAFANADDFQRAIARAQDLPVNIRGSAMRELALLRVDRGDLAGAVEMVRAIADYTIRVRIFRDIAERRAAALDSYGLLGGAAVRPPAKAKSPAAPKEFQQIIGVDFNWAPAAKLHESSPDIRIPEVHADTVRASVPAIAPGTASMILARYNKRVDLSGALATDDTGIFGANIREYLFASQDSVVPAVLMVNSGVHSLTDLIQTATEISPDAIIAEGDAFKISVPIFVRSGATLVLSGLEAKEYRLDTSSGAFIMNSGTLIISDTTLQAFDYKAGKPDKRTAGQKQSFRPFVTSWSGSRTEVANAEIKNLGYFGSRSYGFSMASDPAYIQDKQVNTNKPRGTVVDSTFENLLYGFYSYEAEDVIVIGNEYRDNITYGLDPHDRSLRLVIAYNTAYGSVEKHGGIISREVDDGLIVGNLAFSNHGAGLMVERNSIGNIVYANTSFANGGDGIAIYESPCNLVDSNDSFANGNAGIKVRNSWNVLVRTNHLHANQGAGLEASIADVTAITDDKERDLQRDPFFTYVELDARQNELSANNAGILAKGASRVTLESNVFHSQSPGTFAGDLKSYRAQLLRPEIGRIEGTAACLPARPQARKCSLEEAGLLVRKVMVPATTGEPEKYCTDKPGSLQQRALSAKQAKAEVQ